MVASEDDRFSNNNVGVGSIDYIQNELKRTERQLRTIQQQAQHVAGVDQNSGETLDDERVGDKKEKVMMNRDAAMSSTTKCAATATSRLYHLLNEMNDLNAIYELATTTDYFNKTHEMMHRNDGDDGSDAEVVVLLNDLQRLDILASFLISQHQKQQQQQQSHVSPMNRSILTIYEQEYIPLYQYLRTNFILSIRKQLRQINYPTLLVGKTGTEGSRRGGSDSDCNDDGNDDEEGDMASANQTHMMVQTLDRIIQLCQSYYHLVFAEADEDSNNNKRSTHSNVISIFRNMSAITTTTTDASQYNNKGIDPIVSEFCRPIVERVQYHFISTTSLRTAGGSNKYHSSTHIERLPELLFGYIREYIFDTDHHLGNGPTGSCSPWDMICHIHANLSVQQTTGSRKITFGYDFINEIICTVQCVFSERNFFRHPSIVASTNPATTTSNVVMKPPIHLVKAIEQILQFDSYIQNDVLYGLLNDNNSNDDEDGTSINGTSTAMKHFHHHHKQIIRLMDVCVVGDDELLQWWLDRERESVLSTLFNDDDDDDNQTTDTSKAKKRSNIHRLHRISARAELFCSLLRSIQIKANIFTFTGPYYSAVAVPMCIEFLDAIHETITYMKQQLLSTGNKSKSKLPTNAQLIDMIDQWIEVINGTHMAATMLTTTASVESTTHVVNDDMIRFGHSLQHLQIVIIDDLITTITENMLMERCKFAAYLMRCSHLLSQQTPTSGIMTDNYIGTMSYDLSETHRIISVILSRCWIMNASSANETTYFQNGFHFDVNNFASRMIRERLLSSVAEKILEVALDIHGMTPDLNQYGCSIFAYDAMELLPTNHDDHEKQSSSVVVPEYVLRIVDILQLMKYDSGTLRGIGNALCGLSSQSAPLTEDVFTMDDKLYDEAICMIRAKGFIYIELSDVLTILNRRRDL